ncbi:MAG: hypothetical protein JOZ78_14220 [Chroococcidiopsidaceae cyanobacterium CP_BM_ER_R8_30]|nr:hypothetical protein [Chroococcidiopsidaceae cyanobacterium CP_BM_ER_R8_30]
MATLHVRNVPDDLYARLKQLASAQNRSISAQAVSLLEEALESQSQRQNQSEILAEIRRRRRVNPMNFGLPDSTSLIREDRDR